VILRDGVKKLRKFLEEHGISKRAAARAIGVSLPTMLGWLKGTITPTDPHRKAIAVWTSGAVAEIDWESAQERRALAAAREVAPFEPTGTGGH
jgi:transcriptional regulator with XRE-family HTH domain